MLPEASQLSIIVPLVHPGTADSKCVMLKVCVKTRFVCGCEPGDPEAFMLL